MADCEYCGKQLISNKHFCSSSCYGKWQQGKSFIDQRKPIPPKRYCSVEGCKAIHFGVGYCRKHYCQYVLRQRGEPRPKKGTITKQCDYCGVEFTRQIATSGISPRFCSAKCMGLFRRKPFIVKKGYRKILIPHHPRADRKGYVFEHIVIMESVIGRPLIVGEECHHIDKNRFNNSIDNLTLFTNHAEHMKSHARPSNSTEK